MKNRISLFIYIVFIDNMNLYRAFPRPTNSNYYLIYTHKYKFYLNNYYFFYIKNKKEFKIKNLLRKNVKRI